MATKRKTVRRMATEERGGFTIIEVILVLAIAGLIFLMVFLALPTLQRSQWDTQRQNDMSRLATQIERYRQNNSGKLPTAPSEIEATEDADIPECSREGTSSTQAAACFIRNYMNGVEATENEFFDPDGWFYGLHFEDLGKDSGARKYIDADQFEEHMIYVYYHAKCDGEDVVYSKNARDYAIQYRMEGSGTYCRNNS